MGSYRFAGVVTLLLLCINLFGAGNICSISGEIEFEGEGTLYIYLVNEKLFETPGVGLKTIIKEISKDDQSRLLFEFRNVSWGEYGIRVFLDKNKNGKLDKGAFGPKEPWGMSYRDKKTFGKPKFSQISFLVNNDLNINIKVE